MELSRASAIPLRAVWLKQKEGVMRGDGVVSDSAMVGLGARGGSGEGVGGEEGVVCQKKPARVELCVSSVELFVWYFSMSGGMQKTCGDSYREAMKLRLCHRVSSLFSPPSWRVAVASRNSSTACIGQAATYTNTTKLTTFFYHHCCLEVPLFWYEMLPDKSLLFTTQNFCTI